MVGNQQRHASSSKWVNRSLLFALLGSGLVGGGYGQAWIALVDLFSLDDEGHDGSR